MLNNLYLTNLGLLTIEELKATPKVKLIEEYIERDLKYETTKDLITILTLKDGSATIVNVEDNIRIIDGSYNLVWKKVKDLDIINDNILLKLNNYPNILTKTKLVKNIGYPNTLDADIISFLAVYLSIGSIKKGFITLDIEHTDSILISYITTFIQNKLKLNIDFIPDSNLAIITSTTFTSWVIQNLVDIQDNILPILRTCSTNLLDIFITMVLRSRKVVIIKNENLARTLQTIGKALGYTINIKTNINGGFTIWKIMVDKSERMGNLPVTLRTSLWKNYWLEKIHTIVPTDLYFNNLKQRRIVNNLIIKER